MSKHTISFTEIPAWTYTGSEPSVHTFFPAIKLADLESPGISPEQRPKRFRLSAADQRALLGFPVFGKQQIVVLPDGRVRVSRGVCFGQDWEDCWVTPAQITEAASRGERISPGVIGKGYYNL